MTALKVCPTTAWSKPMFDWDEWVGEHIKGKDWRIPVDFTAAGAAAKAMYDKLVSADGQDDDTSLGCT